MEQIKKKIEQLSKQYLAEIIAIRRHIHQHPELSGEEYKTSDYIASKLQEYGIEFKQGIAKTGIVGLIKGTKLSTTPERSESMSTSEKKITRINHELRTIALRADMDALPIEEKNDIEYKSVNKGVMHACGHDLHMASLLGTAKILNEIKNEFSGTVKLIFQPSEEKYPGGAIKMIEEGVLENPAPDVVIAQHTLPEMQAGKIGVRSGKFMASTDEVFLTVKGRGGHAATPDKNIDAILIASHIVIALQQIVSRNANPAVPTVVSFGRIYSDGRTNIMPDEVKLEGTVRTFNEEWRQEIHNKINKIASTVAEAMGGKCEVFIDKGYPFLVNDYALTNRIRKNAEAYLGDDNVDELDMRMTAEDFSYFSQRVPSCLYRLGVGNKAKGITSNLHTSTFNVDEQSIETSMGLMAWITLNELTINN
jgi:amidohydrolase